MKEDFVLITGRNSIFAPLKKKFEVTDRLFFKENYTHYILIVLDITVQEVAYQNC